MHGDDDDDRNNINILYYIIITYLPTVSGPRVIIIIARFLRLTNDRRAPHTYACACRVRRAQNKYLSLAEKRAAPRVTRYNNNNNIIILIVCTPSCDTRTRRTTHAAPMTIDYATFFGFVVHTPLSAPTTRALHTHITVRRVIIIRFFVLFLLQPTSPPSCSTSYISPDFTNENPFNKSSR